MKTKLLLLLLALINFNVTYGQTYTCPELSDAIAKWNSIKVDNNTKWANAIKENKLYQQNADGSFEYVYIMRCKDSLNVETLRKIGFDFINYYFPNIDNETRANMQTNSPKDGVFFKGKFAGLGKFDSFFEYNKINGNVIYDIRFKADRIRFSIKVQNYQVLKYVKNNLVQNYTEYVSNCFPLNPNSDHKKSYAMAFINANSNCLNYASNFLNYVNKNVKESQPTETEDW